MFVNAIEKVKGFTRPIYTISRLYGDTTVEPGAATLFFVNELGFAITCKHVAALLAQSDFINGRHKKFSEDKKSLPAGGKYNRRLRELEQKHQLGEGVITQIKSRFVSCVDKMSSFEIHAHQTADLAIVHFVGFEKLPYQGYATTKSLYSSGKLLEAEQAIAKSMCGETDSCGKITESKSISVSGGTGIEFIIQYKGLRIDEPRGFLNEIHRTILKNGVIYRFWTSEQVAPIELKNEYPKLDPSPIELFRKILDTFRAI